MAHEEELYTSVFYLSFIEEELISLSEEKNSKLQHSEILYSCFFKFASQRFISYINKILSECGFSTLTNKKSKKRSKLINVVHELRIALPFLRPNISEIINKCQAQIGI